MRLTIVFLLLLCCCMDELVGNLRAAIIPAAELDSEGSWDCALFLRSQGQRGRTFRSQPLSAYATVFEGVRSLPGLRDPESAGIYRASALTQFEINPTQEQWTSILDSAKFQIQPGDVILKRIAPVSAAVVPAGLPLHAVDGNFFVIRGLRETEAWWLAFCLNQSGCADYLLSKSGRGVLSRISLSVLRDWKVPATPPEFTRLAHRLGELLQKRVFLAGRMAALRAEVETIVAEQMAATAYAEVEQRFAPRCWSFFFPPALADVSWLPLHVASEYRAAVLRADRDWQPLHACLLPDAPSRNRFSSVDESIPVLRLSDVAVVPLISAALAASVPVQATRIFRDPVQPEEVLLSTLGSSPRVAFAQFNPQPPVYAVDLWERLRFRTHAAAFVLILQTGAVTRQLRSLASGSVQQFIRSEDIHRLFLPVLPEETLAQWDRGFRSLGKSWQQADSDWRAALQEGWQIFFSSFNPPVSQAHSKNP